MLVVGVLPLLAGLVMAFLQGTQEIHEVSGASFTGLAAETARTLDLVLSEEIDRLAGLATDRLIVEALENRRDVLQGRTGDEVATLIAQAALAWDTKDPMTVRVITQGKLADVLRRYYAGTYVDPERPAPIVTRSATRALFITDMAGVLIASINTGVPYADADEPWWRGAFNNGIGKPYIENVLFDDRLGVYTFSLSLPVMDRVRYQAVGVIHRVYDAKEFFAPSVDTIQFGKTGHVMLIDSHGTVLSCPILPTGSRLADAALIPLVTPPQPGWVKAPSDGHGGQSTSVIGFSPLASASRITRGSTGSGWHTFVWQASSELFAPVRHLVTWISVFGVLAGGLLLALGYVAADRMVGPIRRLKEAATLIGRGELRDPIRIQTGDEIEDLADEINRMNAQLEAAFAGLADQVELKAQEVRYLQKSTGEILDSIPTPIIMLDREARAQYMNRVSKHTFGITVDGMSSSNFFDLIPLDEPLRKRLRRELHALVNDTDESGDLPSTTAQAPSPGLRDPLAPPRVPVAGPERRELYIGERIYRYEWFRISGRLGEGQQIGLVLRDTTGESRLQDQLLHTEKLESLGVLGAGIGHELNNPLCGVLGLGEAIQDEDDLARAKSYARDIIRHGKRMASIIQDFTGLVRADAEDRRVPVDIQGELDQALKLVQLTNEGAVLDIHTNYQPLPKITAKPDEVRLAFMHVLINAVQAMQGRGTLWIATEVTDGVITVTIRDSGPGIPRGYLMKVFDPFFTTKRQGEGTGLGLTIARRIVMKCGGHIQIHSEEGRGATCLMTFEASGSLPGKEGPP
jgi:signal transduction histidine kinase